MVDVQREGPLLQRDVPAERAEGRGEELRRARLRRARCAAPLLVLAHLAHLAHEPPLVRNLKARHLDELVLVGVVADGARRLDPQRPALAREADAASAVLGGVEDLEQRLTLLVGRQRRVVALPHVEQLLVRQVGPGPPLEQLGRGADLAVRAPDLPRLAEAL